MNRRLCREALLSLVPAILCLQIGLSAGSAAAQDSHTAALIERAKKEASLVWYTSTSIEDAKSLLDTFNKKYPSIKTEFFNAGSARVFNRILNEARAGKIFFDLVAVRGVETQQLVKAGFLQPYVSPESGIYPPGFKDAKGFWVDYFDAYNVIGYNTKLVTKDQAPKSWEDLLDPKWKGKIALDEEMYSWYGAMILVWGKEKAQRFMKALAKQDIQLRSGHTLMTELVAAGEIPLVLTLYNQAVDKMKEKGAPIDWRPLPPAFGRADGIAVAKRAPHPHAALLFADFVLSPQGQRIIKERSRVPVNRTVDSSFQKFNFRIIDLSTLVDEWDTWEKRWQTLFLKAMK